MSKIRWLLAALGVALVSLAPVLGASAPAGADPGTILKFTTMTPVTGPYVGAANPIRTVPGGGLPWIITAGNGALKSDGHLIVHVRGLVLADQAPVPPALPADELTTLTAWAEALAEALTLAPQQLDAVLADARDGTRWRAALGLPEPSAELVHALDVIERILRAAPAAAGAPPPDAVLAAAQNPAPDEPGLERLARRVLRAAVEQIVTRQTRAGHDAHSNRNPTSGRTT